MLLDLRGMQKRFGGVQALSNGTLQAAAGEVHLLMGENGAGKSTLMKIVAGLLPADSGTFRFRGQPARFRRPAEAAAAGIAMVHQESLLAPHLSVAENIFLGREECGPFGWVHRRQMAERARRLLAEHKFPLQAEARVGTLNPAGKQLVEICRAIQHGSSLLIFDEPTSSLSESESREVFRIVQALKERGVGVIYITHRLEELRSVGDRVTILRDGETVHSALLSGLTLDQLIRHMVGREMTALHHRESLEPGETLLAVKGLSRRGLFKDISFSLRAGEIVGLAGMIGAGRTELCRALFGVEPPDAGCIVVAGKYVTVHSPRDAVRAGLALIPEDRQDAGLAKGLSVGANLTIASLDRVSSGFGVISPSLQRAVESRFLPRLRIKTDSPGQLAGRLSGGNQQKVVIAKWLARGARVFLFDEPTRGIDVGAKAEVFALMDELARQGAAILMVSSEIPELLQVADRILVMRQGRLSGELARPATAEAILRLAAFEETVP